jgi:nicotinate-nucleotide adenylyltransferase
MSNIRTGIFGGSFDPIHNGHISLARQLLDMCGLDEIWFVVSPLNPFKVNLDLLNDEARIEMVRAALENEPQMTASDFEFNMPKPSYTWDTLRSMSLSYPEREFTLLIGGDNWTSFQRWFAHEEIVSHYAIAIYPRHNFDIDISSLPSNVTLVNTELIDISSTEIRRLIATGQSITGLVPPVVERMIAENHYYSNAK